MNLAINPSEDCLKTIGLDGTLLAMDHHGMCLMEIGDFRDVSGISWDSMWPSETQAAVRASVETALSGRVARFSADCLTPKGTIKSWDVSVSPIRDATGQIIALQSLSHDVTQREASRREERLVAQELSHRIQNLFAVVDGLIHMSGRRHDGAEPFVATLRERLGGLGRAISFIHPMSYNDQSTAPRTVHGLIAALLAPYTGAGASVDISGDDVNIGQGALTSVAMVLNELATNAVKYGAMKDTLGHLDIRISRQLDMLFIEWVESGVTDLVPPTETGFGTTLLDRTIQSQLEGSIERRWASDGLTALISIPTGRLG